jgi:hypothetical protein
MKNHFRNFSKYAIIGIIISFLNIVLVTLSVDILGITGLISSLIIVGFLFFLKFYLYLITGFIKKKLLHYAYIQIVSALMNITATWILVDIFEIYTLAATTFIVGTLFFLRYLLIHYTGLSVRDCR